MLSPKTKLKILEQYHAIDYLLFGKHLSEIDFGCMLCKEEYVKLKGLLTSTITEIYKLIDRQAEYSKQDYTKDMVRRNAIKLAMKTREKIRPIVQSEDIKKEVQQTVINEMSHSKTITTEELMLDKIAEKTFSIGLDNMFIEQALYECPNPKIIKTLHGKILSETYRTIREELVESALFIYQSYVNDNN